MIIVAIAPNRVFGFTSEKSAIEYASNYLFKLLDSPLQKMRLKNAQTIEEVIIIAEESAIESIVIGEVSEENGSVDPNNPEADYVLGEDDYVLNEEDGCLIVCKDIIDGFEQDAYVNIQFCDGVNEGYNTHCYKMIAETTDCVILEFIGDCA